MCVKPENGEAMQGEETEKPKVVQDGVEDQKRLTTPTKTPLHARLPMSGKKLDKSDEIDKSDKGGKGSSGELFDLDVPPPPPGAGGAVMAQ